jgi:phenylacetate-CoA ligase
VYTSPYPFSSVFGLYPLIFVSTLEPVEQILRIFVRERPHLIVCYPSHLRQIAELASEQQIASIRPTLISVSSEMSSQSERDHLAQVFGCPALDNYSSEELARIAAQCPHKVYHLFEDMNFVETLDEEGNPTTELGRVVGTNLHNRAMPLIRYQQDDLAQITGERCACGWNFRTLRSIQGRRNDAFILPSGRVLTSGFLLDATYEFLLEHRAAVRDFSLVQESARSIRLELVPGRHLSPAIQARITNRFREFLEPGVEFRTEIVQECERTRTGKRNPIIRYSGRAEAELHESAPTESVRR